MSEMRGVSVVNKQEPWQSETKLFKLNETDCRVWINHIKDWQDKNEEKNDNEILQKCPSCQREIIVVYLTLADCYEQQFHISQPYTDELEKR